MLSTFSTLAEDVLDPRVFIDDNANITGEDWAVALGTGFLLLIGLVLLMTLLGGSLLGGGGLLSRVGGGGPQAYNPGYNNDYSSYNDYNGYNTDFQARSLGHGYDAINVLYMLEEAFRKMEVLEFECQQRLVCEAHEAGASDKYGEVATRLQKIIGSAEPVPEGTEKEIAAAVTAFRDAATHGIQQRDCARTYATKCAKGLREYVSSNTKY